MVLESTCFARTSRAPAPNIMQLRARKHCWSLHVNCLAIYCTLAALIFSSAQLWVHWKTYIEAFATCYFITLPLLCYFPVHNSGCTRILAPSYFPIGVRNHLLFIALAIYCASVEPTRRSHFRNHHSNSHPAPIPEPKASYGSTRTMQPPLWVPWSLRITNAFKDLDPKAQESNTTGTSNAEWVRRNQTEIAYCRLESTQIANQTHRLQIGD